MAVGFWCVINVGMLVFGVVMVLGVVLIPHVLLQDVDVKIDPLLWQKYKQLCETILADRVELPGLSSGLMPLLLFKPGFHLCLQAVIEMKKQTLLRLVILLCLGSLKCNRAAALTLQNCFLWR